MKRPIDRLTPSQREQLLQFLPSGGDLATVCKVVGASLVQLKLEMKHDPEFAQAVARAEAAVELRQMNNVLKAAQDEKNWRTSVWWIERRTRERLSGDGRGLSEADVIELLDELARAIVDEIPDPAAQRRVIERLLQVVARDEEKGAGSTLPPHGRPPELDSEEPASLEPARITVSDPESTADRCAPSAPESMP